jgi:hypothetical protein
MNIGFVIEFFTHKLGERMNGVVDSITCFVIMVPSRPYNTARLYCMSGFKTKKLVILDNYNYLHLLA